MNYLRGNSFDNFSGHRRFSWSWAWFFVLVLIYFLGPTLLGWLFRPLVFVGQPVWSAAENWSNSLQRLSTYFSSKNNLVEENKNLKRSNENLRIALLNKQILQRENSDLRQVLSLTKNSQKFVLGQIIARPNQTPYDILLVDIGSQNHFVKVGDKVVASGQTVLLGEVAEVYGGSKAKVKLYSSYGSQIAINISRLNLAAVAKGLGGGNFSISLPKGVGVKVGDIIESPSGEKLILGQVGKIEETATNPYLRVLFKIPVNIYELQWVMIYVDY